MRACVRSRIMCNTSQKSWEVFFFYYSTADTLTGDEGAGGRRRPPHRRLIVFKRFRFDPNLTDSHTETLIARPSLRDRRSRQKNKK